MWWPIGWKVSFTIDELCLRRGQQLPLRPERCSTELKKRIGNAIDQTTDSQPKESSHETSDNPSIAGSKLHRLEHDGSKRSCLRSRRGSRRLRRCGRSCRRRTACCSTCCRRCCCRATGRRCGATGWCSPQGVLNNPRRIRSKATWTRYRRCAAASCNAAGGVADR
jgi:hypothetical protein